MKRGVLFLVSFIFTLLPAFCDSDLIEDYFDIAQNFCESGMQSKAVEYLDYILQIEPNNTKAKTLKLQIISLAPVPPEGISFSAPTPQEVSETAQMLGTQQNVEQFKILKISETDTEKMSYDENYYNKKGMFYYKERNWDAAAEYFFKAVKINKKFAQGYNNLGMVYRAKNAPKIAIKYFKKAHRCNKKYSQPLVNAALTYKQLDKNQFQLYYLNKAIEVNPTDYWALYLLGDYYKNENNYALAISNFKKATVVNKNFKEAYLQLGICLLETDETNAAAAALSKYSELNPESDFAIYLLARLKLSSKDYQSAKALINRAIAVNNVPEYRLVSAKIDYLSGNYQNALNDFQKLSQEITSPEIFNYIGLSQYKLHNVDEAIITLNKAIMLDPARPMYYYNLAQMYKTKKDIPSYNKFLKAGLRIQPVTIQDYMDLSTIYMDNQNTDYALNMINSGILKFPNSKELYLAKLKIYEVTGDIQRYGDLKNTIDMRFADEKK